MACLRGRRVDGKDSDAGASAIREYVTNEDKSVVLDPEKLALVTDPHVAMAVRLEPAFRLRREEAIKFTLARDDQGDRIRLKGSAAKAGARVGRPRPGTL